MAPTQPEQEEFLMRLFSSFAVNGHERTTAEKQEEIRNMLDALGTSEDTMANMMKFVNEASPPRVYDERLPFFDDPKTPWSRAMTQFASFLQKSDFMSIEKCHVYAMSCAQHIFEDWQYLKKALFEFEPLIRELWKKKTVAQRRAILLTVWPHMHAQHRPDLEAFRQIKSNVAGVMSPAVIWPYINLEDLLEPNTLLIFLDSRGRYPPDTFAYSDLERAPTYKYGPEILKRRKDNFTMGFLGRKSADKYGALLSWKTAAAATEAINTGRSVHVEHGIQILSIQSRIMYFLRSCVAEILKQGPLYVPKKTIDLPQLVDTNGTCSIFSKDAPYRVPQCLDLPRLEALASGIRNQAIDHVIALREDPGYFAEVVGDYRNHHKALILDQQGEIHNKATGFPLYGQALRQTAVDAHWAVFEWNHTHNSLTNIRSLYTKNAPKIRVEEDLPKELFDAVAEFQFFLEMFKLEFITLIKEGFAASPPLRQYFYRVDCPEKSPWWMSIGQIPSLDTQDAALQRVLQFKGFFDHQEMRESLTMHSLLDDFERLIQANPHAKAFISPYMATLFSQLSIVSECLHQFQQFQPWAKKIDSHIRENLFMFQLRYAQMGAGWARLTTIQRKVQEDIHLFELGTPTDGKFDYPSDKRRTRDSVQRMIAAETALHAFWEGINTKFHLLTGTNPSALVQHIIGERQWQRTAPWVEPTKQPLIAAEQLHAFSPHLHDATKQVTGTFDKSSVSFKSKVKTRGDAAAANDQPVILHAAAVVVAAEPVSNSSPKIVVDKRALKVFSTLFHSPDDPNQPGEVSWRNFLHAMTSAGFGAEKLHGSAWNFSSTAAETQWAISFHEPHPNDKLPFTWVRRYGRRLTRAFGWSLETFSLA